MKSLGNPIEIRENSTVLAQEQRPPGRPVLVSEL